ncbi:hypothetical protein INT47_011831 [Mucor saturninus]|uniref:Uncharacterized protein n=1 Tax=Mucor saturninus TaxID=64648 RepID=A0A8H7V2G4_9FUNG|nr:hypothetical protein INT47_011831 [Mucor saturninus]
MNVKVKNKSYSTRIKIEVLDTLWKVSKKQDADSIIRAILTFYTNIKTSFAANVAVSKYGEACKNYFSDLENKTNLQEVIRTKLDLKDLEELDKETLHITHSLRSKTKSQKGLANAAKDYQAAKFEADALLKALDVDIINSSSEDDTPELQAPTQSTISETDNVFTVQNQTESVRKRIKQEAMNIHNEYVKEVSIGSEAKLVMDLGVMRYLVTLMVKSNLLNASEKGRIQEFLINYRISKAFSRSFRNELKHCGSFVGRDFKQFMQVLPMGLRILFGHNNNRLEPLVSSFVCLGRLASLVYVRQVFCKKDFYIELVQGFCADLVSSLLILDNLVISLNIANPPNIFLKPKIHLLTHLHEDINRFGCALHYETEKGEQFDKFIREHLFQTNRQNTSRDVTVRSGKQLMFRFIFTSGSIVVCHKRSGEPDRFLRSQAG